MAKKDIFLMVVKAKQKFFLENCKCFFKKEKVVLRGYFFWGGLRRPPDFGSGYISVNFEKFFDIVIICCLPCMTNLSIKTLYALALCLEKNLTASMAQLVRAPALDAFDCKFTLQPGHIHTKDFIYEIIYLWYKISKLL